MVLVVPLVMEATLVELAVVPELDVVRAGWCSQVTHFVVRNSVDVFKRPYENIVGVKCCFRHYIEIKKNIPEGDV